MPSLAELAGVTQGPDGSLQLIQPNMFDQQDEPPDKTRMPSLSDLAGGRATLYDDGTFEYHDVQPQAQAPADRSAWDIAYNTLMATGVGVGSGVEMAGALAELVYPSFGETIRQTGISAEQYLRAKMDPTAQQAMDRSWLDLSSEGAIRNPESWLYGVASQLPYMIGTGGVGELTALGLRAVGKKAVQAAGETVGERVAAEQALKAAARTKGYKIAAAGAGAAEAAAGAAQATDAAGLSPSERETAMWAAAPLGALSGLVVGPKLEELLHGAGKGLVSKVLTGAAAEGIEEISTAAASEVGKAAVGLPVDVGSVIEQGAAGMFMGGGAGAAIHVGQYPAARRLKELNASRTAASAEAQAILSEANRIQEEDRIKEEQLKARALPAPAAGSYTSMPIETGAEQFGQQPLPTYPGVPPPAGPMGGPTVPFQTAVGQTNFVSPAGQAYSAKLDNQVTQLGAKLDEIKTALNTTTDAGERVKLTAQFRDVRKQYNEAQRLQAEFNANREKLTQTQTQQQLRLGDITEEGTPGDINLQAVNDMDMKELDAELKKWFSDEPGAWYQPDEPGDTGYPEPSQPIDELPLNKLLNAKLARIQAAAKGAETKRRNKLAAQRGPLQSVQDQVDEIPATAPQTAGTRGNAEQQAVRGTLPTNSDQPSIPDLNKQAIDTPATPAEGALAAPEQAPPGPGAAAQAPPEQAGTAAPPQALPGEGTAPLLPQTERGGVTKPPTVLLLGDEMPTQEQMAYRDQTQIVGSEPPASIMPQIEQMLMAKTKPRAKPLAKLTPRERLSKVLSAGPQPVHVVLKHMLDALQNTTDTRTYRLTKRLLESFPTFMPRTNEELAGSKQGAPTGVVIEARPLSNGFQGLYDPRTNRIYIDTAQAEDSLGTLLHEVVHAATLFKLRTNKSFRDKITRYMTDMRLMWAAKNADLISADAAFHDPEEFISRILTDHQFADEMARTPASKNNMDQSVWFVFKNRLKTLFGTRADPVVRDMFETLLEMIPDGSMLQHGNNQQELLTQMDNLGISQPVASLLTSFRSMLRQTAANPGQTATVATGGSRRVWEMMLPGMATPQIAESYGDLGKSYLDPKTGREVKLNDTINQFYKLNDIKDGYAESLRAVADRIVSVGKQAAQQTGTTKAVDDVLTDSRLWMFDPDKPMLHPANQRGASLPGGALLFPQLQQRFNALSPLQKDYFRLVRDHAAAQRFDHINQTMLWRTAERVDRATAEQLANLIYHSSRVVTNVGPMGAPSNVNIVYNQPLSAAEVKTFVNGLALNPVKQKLLYRDLRQVSRAMGQADGIYIPLRRTGDYYVMIRNDEGDLTRGPITKAAYDRLVADNKRNQGDMVITSDGQLPNGMYRPRGYHMSVTGVDTENEGKQLLEDVKQDWTNRGLRWTRSEAALKRENLYGNLGISSSTVQALRRNLEDKLGATLGPQAAKAASDQTLTYFLERLPESSIRKTQLHAKRIAGASRDSLHVFSQYANGAAYLSAEMKYGADVRAQIGSKMDEDIAKLHAAANAGGGEKLTDQANDLTKIKNFLNRRETSYDRLVDKAPTKVGQWGMSVWKAIPQITGAWLLTGPGTVIANSFQVWQFGLPYLSARFNPGAASTAIMTAYKDLTRPTFAETWEEYKRFGKGIVGAAKVAMGKQAFTATIKDPKSAIWEKATAALPVNEQNAIRALAMRKKVDFGLTADIKSLSERASGPWMAIQYMMEGAFISSQASETLNRMTMGLAAYRLNQAKVTTDVNNDRSILPASRAEEIERRLVDLAAEAIDKTQWNYSAHARPLIFQNEVLRAATVFKTFPQNVWYTLTHNIIQSMHAKTAEERWIARKMVAGLFATTVVTSGLMGVLAFDPFYLAAVALTRMLTDDDDPEQALRDALHGFMGDWTDLLLRGAPYGSGLMDTTNRMGFASMFPIQDWVRPSQPGQTNNTMYDKMKSALGEGLMGAPGSMVFQQMWPAGKAFANGDYATAVEKMMPKAFGMNDLVQAWNMHNRGLVDTRGSTYMGSKDLTYRDIIARALGFDTENTSQAKAIRRTFYQEDDKLTSGKQALIAEFAEAQIARDANARTDALVKIKQWNKDHRIKGYVITGPSLKQAVLGRVRGDYTVATYGVAAKSPGQKKLLETIRERYGG